MFKTMTTMVKSRLSRRLVLISCLLVLLLGLILPGATFAAPPPPAGAENCAECHALETAAWQDSPHARAVGDKEGTLGATCEACHGPYIEDHPEAGVMQLTVDSSVCEDCHTGTFEQWGHSRHAQAGVQCIGCHLSHSQEFRLTDEALCGSCHRDRLEDFTHTAHGTAGVTCIDCHLSSTATEQIALVSTGPGDRSLIPSHDFTGVSSEDCISCHGQDVHDLLPDTDRAVDPRLLAMAESVPALTTKLETAQQSNKSLQIMAPVCLGLGIGIGGMLGIIFMLVVGYINQRRAK